MTKEEINECKFIDDIMKFYTYTDFIQNKMRIREAYLKLKNPIFYKWFVYANINCTLPQKDNIWKFLNTDSPESFVFKNTKEEI